MSDSQTASRSPFLLVCRCRFRRSRKSILAKLNGDRADQREPLVEALRTGPLELVAKMLIEDSDRAAVPATCYHLRRRAGRLARVVSEHPSRPLSWPARGPDGYRHPRSLDSSLAAGYALSVMP